MGEVRLLSTTTRLGHCFNVIFINIQAHSHERLVAQLFGGQNVAQTILCIVSCCCQEMMRPVGWAPSVARSIGQLIGCVNGP